MLWIKTIDFPDRRSGLTLVAMDANLYALEILVRERLTHARDEARRQDLAALAAPVALRVRLGVALIALGAWLRGEPELAVAEQS
jgi:hypothetical protein